MLVTSILAEAAHVANDCVAVAGIAACIGSLVFGLFDLGVEPGSRRSDPFLGTALFCVFSGGICQIALLSQPVHPDTIGIVFRFSVPFTNLLFVGTLLMLVFRLVVLRRSFDVWA
jgi:hypothetical protein